MYDGISSGSGFRRKIPRSWIRNSSLAERKRQSPESRRSAPSASSPRRPGLSSVFVRLPQTYISLKLARLLFGKPLPQLLVTNCRWVYVLLGGLRDGRRGYFRWADRAHGKQLSTLFGGFCFQQGGIPPGQPNPCNIGCQFLRLWVHHGKKNYNSLGSYLDGWVMLPCV